jgi:hypothetical protein
LRAPAPRSASSARDSGGRPRRSRSPHGHCIAGTARQLPTDPYGGRVKTISATGQLLVDLLARVEVAGWDRNREQYSDSTRKLGAVHARRGDGDTDADEVRRLPQGRTNGDGRGDRRISSPGLWLGTCGARRSQAPKTRLFVRRLCARVGIHERGRRACRGRGASPYAADRMGEDDGHLGRTRSEACIATISSWPRRQTCCIADNRSACGEAEAM